MIPNSFIVKWEERTLTEISIIATKYDQKGQPISWGIKKNGHSAMSKIDGNFYTEPRPSSRDKKFFDEFRFDSAELAYKSYKKFYETGN